TASDGDRPSAVPASTGSAVTVIGFAADRVHGPPFVRRVFSFVSYSVHVATESSRPSASNFSGVFMNSSRFGTSFRFSVFAGALSACLFAATPSGARQTQMGLDVTAIGLLPI